MIPPINPSGIICSSCNNEIDLFDGPVRRIGKPQQFPFCWDCWRDLYRALPQHQIIAEDVGDELHIWIEEERDL